MPYSLQSTHIERFYLKIIHNNTAIHPKIPHKMKTDTCLYSIQLWEWIWHHQKVRATILYTHNFIHKYMTWLRGMMSALVENKSFSFSYRDCQPHVDILLLLLLSYMTLFTWHNNKIQKELHTIIRCTTFPNLTHSAWSGLTHFIMVS